MKAFYKYDGKRLYRALNYIYFPNGVTLTKETHENFSYPIESWYWFNSLDEALDHFGLDEVPAEV